MNTTRERRIDCVCGGRTRQASIIWMVSRVHVWAHMHVYVVDGHI